MSCKTILQKLIKPYLVAVFAFALLFATSAMASIPADAVLSVEILPVFQQPALQEEEVKVIFTEPLVNEFERRYHYQFGDTPISYERLETNHFTQITYRPGVQVSALEDSQRRQDFGSYMVRRLAEYHIDSYAKESENLQPAYQMKEKLSKVKFEFKKGYGVNLNYSISNNSINLKLNNPFNIDANYSLDLSTNLEVLALGYAVSKKTKVNSYYRQYEDSVSLVTSRKIDDNLTASVTAKKFMTERVVDNRSVENIYSYDDLVIVGLHWRL